MLKGRIEQTYPIVVPTVIYTGFQKWNAKTNFGEKQYNSKLYGEYKINLGYNLIAIQNYSFEELLEKRSLFAIGMIIEKCRTKEELSEQIIQIIENIREEDKKELAQIIKNIVVPQIGKENSKKILEKIKEKEMVGMSPLTKMLLDWEKEKEEAKAISRKEGKVEGRKKGKIEAMLETAQKLLERKMNIDDIQEITGISKEKLENMQKGMVMKS